MTRMTHVVSSTSRLAGGLFHAVRGLAGAQRAAGTFDVGVYGLEDASTGEDLASWLPLAPRTFPVLGPASFGYSAPLRRALAASGSDLLHCHGLWMYPSKAALGWWKRTRGPYVVSSHGMLDPWAASHARLKKAAAAALFQREHLERAACLHSLCASETRSLGAWGLRRPVCQIPNGVDLPGPDPHARAPWTGSLGPDARVLLYLGRLHPKKGLPALVEAFGRVAASDNRAARDWHLAIAGWDQDGHLDLLRGMVRQRGLEGRVLFTGALYGAAKDGAFRLADAFVLPSHSEGLPVAVLEAWSHGLPVLMTPACNLPEGYGAGAAVEISPDADALETSLAAFFGGDPEARRVMGLKGRDLVERRFTWARIARDMDAVYLWLLDRGPRPDCVSG